MIDTDGKEPNEEFDQFEDLTRQLLAVSKDDLDRERKVTPDPPPKA